MALDIVASFVAGAATAPLAVIAWEQLLKEPPARRRPACPGCDTPLPWRRLMPFAFTASWLAGRCGCGRRYPGSRAAAEAGFGALAVACLAAPHPLAIFFLAWCCLVLSVTDIKEFVIPDEISLALAVAGVVGSPWLTWQQSLLWGAVGGFGFWLFGRAASMIMKKDALGFGDVKLIAGFGAWAGWQGVYSSIILGSVVGAVCGAVLLAGRSNRMIPFGPYLAAGFLLHLFWGERILAILLPLG